ncbi:MAG: DUF2313 domain-containing protein [Labilithrix sp.]|nr:DUF2313 domain-containing protein [Labilithrix sp.]
MPAFGGMTPFPLRCGGGAPRVELLLQSLNAGRGKSVDTSESSVAYVENMAHARAIAAVWLESERLGNQWVPELMTDCLPRWERICGIIPAPGDSLVVRRQRIAKRFARIGLVLNRAAFTSMLRNEVGDVFVDVEYISPERAVIIVPLDGYPFGTVVKGVRWYSTVLHVPIRLQKPRGYTEGDFYDAAAKVAALAGDVLPAWCTFDWYRAPTGGPSIDVPGGPSAAGFYLDQDHNLDNHVFD